MNKSLKYGITRIEISLSGSSISKLAENGRLFAEKAAI